MQKVVFHRDIFKEIPEDGSGTSLSVLLHKKSRRFTCSIPLKTLASYIHASIESNNFKLFWYSVSGIGKSLNLSKFGIFLK